MSSMETSSFVITDSVTDLPVDAGFSTFLYHIFSKELYTDIYFVLNYGETQTTIGAHKFVLSLKSAYFADLFNGNDKKETSEFISLTDICPVAFKAMLNYMYDHHVPSIESPKTAYEIYKVADKFHVHSVKNECSKKLNAMNISSSNVLFMLGIAECVQNINTTDRCLAFIKNNTREVIESYKLSEISSSVINIFLSLEEFSIESELNLFMWVFAWADEIRKVGEERRIREVLKEFLPQLPFASLSTADFAQLYDHYKEAFKDDEVISIFVHHAGSDTTLPPWYNKDHRIRVIR